MDETAALLAQRPLIGLSDDQLLTRVREHTRSDDALDQLLNEIEIRYLTQQRSLLLAAEEFDRVAADVRELALIHNSEGAQNVNGNGMTSIVGGGLLGGMVLGC